MAKKPLFSGPDAQTIADGFGDLSLVMLTETPLAASWRVSFLANFKNGPVFREILKEFGITRPGFAVLFCLQQRSGLVARDICRVTGQPKNSISRAISELLEAGLIVRETDEVDKRAKRLALTDAGRKLLEQILPLFEERQAAMYAPLSEDEREAFDRLIAKIITGMPKWVLPD